MAGNKQLVAVFLMCMAVIAALHLNKAEASVYSDCYNQCHEDCFENGASGNSNSYCEVKCDSECGLKELEEKIKNFKP